MMKDGNITFYNLSNSAIDILRAAHQKPLSIPNSFYGAMIDNIKSSTEIVSVFLIDEALQPGLWLLRHRQGLGY